MKEERGGEQEAVDAVENAAVTGEESAAVFDIEIAFKGGDGDVAQETEGGDAGTEKEAFDETKGCEDGRQGGREEGGGAEATPETGPGFVRAYAGKDFAFAELFAPEVLGDIVEFGEGDQVEHPSGAAALGIDFLWEGEEPGGVAQAEDGNHQSPLHHAGGVEKAFGFLEGNQAHGEDEEHKYRDKDDKHAVPLLIDPEVLEGDGEVGPEQDASVDLAGGDEGDVFFEGEVGDEHEEEHPGLAAGEDGTEDKNTDDPPGLNAVFQFAGIAFGIFPSQAVNEEGGEDEEGEDNGGNPFGGEEGMAEEIHSAVSRALVMRFRIVRMSSRLMRMKRGDSQGPAGRPRPRRKARRPKTKARSLLPMGPS